MKRLAGLLVALGLAGLAAALLLWALPASDFVFEPGTAKPLADRVQVEGGRPNTRGGMYYVDVLVRRTSRLEDLIPALLPEGAEVVPEHEILPPGTSETDRDRQTTADMQRSEEVASAVALETLGYDVEATPKGALVIGVAADVPAAGEIETGDVITAVDGVAVRTPDDLRRQIGKREPGDPIELTVRRGGKSVQVTTRTVAAPDDPERPIIGITVDQEADIELPLDVEIDLGQVGGPSAGLAFALEIARLLGRNVTKGCKIAATGELALDGSVLPVGGVEQKTIGARKTGVDVFVVPVGDNTEEARSRAGDLEILAVESYQQALRRLTTGPRQC